MKAEKITATVGDFKLRHDKDKPREGQNENKNIADGLLGKLLLNL